MAIRDKTYIQNEMLKYKNNPITIECSIHHKSQSKTSNLKVVEEAESLDQNVPIFLETLKRAHQRICGNKNK